MGWPGLGDRREPRLRKEDSRGSGGGGGPGVATGTGKHGPCALATVRRKEASGTARRGSGAINEAGRNVLLGGGLRVGHLFGGEGTAKES